MKLYEQQHGAVTVLHPDGPITGTDSDRFKARLLEVFDETLGRFVVDASAIAFVDSKSLEALVDVNEKMAESGQSLKLCGVEETFRRVLELTELAQLFEHFEDVNVAVRSFL